MESYLNDFNSILRNVFEAEEQAEELIASFEERLQSIITKYAPSKSKDTPVKPNKKKLKARPEKIDSHDNPADDISHISGVSTCSSVEPSGQTTSVTNSTISTVSTVDNDDTQFLRPVRTTKVKALGSLKEPTLKTKLRRENKATEPAITDVRVKIERVSSVENNVTTSVEVTDKVTKEAVVRIKREKLSVISTTTTTTTASSTATATAKTNATDIPTTSVITENNNNTNNKNNSAGTTSDSQIKDMAAAKRKSSDEGTSSIGDGDELNEALKKRNDSIEILPMDTNRTILLSDEDEADEGVETDKEGDERIMPPPSFIPANIKKEKRPTKNSRAKRAEDDEKCSEARPIRSTRSKQSKVTKVKTERVSENHEHSETNTENPPASGKSTKEKKTNKHAQPLNQSGESVYEDAISEQNNKVFNSYVRIERNEAQSSQQNDATFVTTTGSTETVNLSPRATYVIPNASNAVANKPVRDATFFVEPKSYKAGINNETVVISGKASAEQRKKISTTSSIMTEDDSDGGGRSPIMSPMGQLKSPLRPHNGIAVKMPLSKQKTKELFNPCIQKTMKQKVEAFEKLRSPLTQRETRTRTRQGTNDPDKFVKPQVPHISKAEQTTRHLRANSATRYQTNKTASAILTKSQSVDDIRRKNQAVADEKKKKRDEKLRLAQQQREQQEREKTEKYKKLVLEKEQRIKESQLKKQQEEQQRFLEQKRKEAEREQARKEAKAAADRRERENVKILLEKKALEEKLRMNQRAAELQQQKMKSTIYNFDMLESGDSTDEEGKESRKRPPPPVWSISMNRMPYIICQSRVDTKVIDNFFSVEPREVDLREIFPKIDDKYLRRNSSAVWRTPPRYSLMPKY